MDFHTDHLGSKISSLGAYSCEHFQLRVPQKGHIMKTTHYITFRIAAKGVGTSGTGFAAVSEVNSEGFRRHPTRTSEYAHIIRPASLALMKLQRLITSFIPGPALMTMSGRTKVRSGQDPGRFHRKTTSSCSRCSPPNKFLNIHQFVRCNEKWPLVRSIILLTFCCDAGPMLRCDFREPPCSPLVP